MQNIPDKIQVAVLFHNCNATQLTNVHITSPGNTGSVVYNPIRVTGAVVYNPVGVVNITSCLFSMSGYQGGGLVIEVNETTSRSSCIITNSTFTHNTADISYYKQMRRGGISVVFNGNAAYNTVQLDQVRVANNKGSGGILLVFDDDTNGNTVIVNGAEVIGNTAYSYNSGVGGGVCIEIASSDSDSSNCPYNCPSGNTVSITNSRFISNVAKNSGGAIAAIVEANCDDSLTLSIENCVFNNNYATHRSIIYQNSVHDDYLTIQNSTILPWHSIAVNYPNFFPAECNWQGWVVFIFLQLVPLWIMMILLAVLH